MKQKLLIALSSLVLILTLTNSVIAQDKSEEATESADIDSEAIKENIKKRIQEVIKNQTADGKKKIAITGTISTITTNSFSVETEQGVRQASMSATATTVVELPGNKEVKLDDVGIGDYVAALGYIPETNQVLDARRLLILRTPPVKPVLKPFYGILQNVDLKKKSLEVENAKLNEKQSFVVSTKTDLLLKDPWGREEEITLKDLPVNTPVLILQDESKVISVTVKSATQIKPKVLEATPSANPSR